MVVDPAPVRRRPMAGPVTAVGGTDESTEALLSSSSLDSMAIDQAAASDASLPMSHQQNSHPLKDHACRHHSHQPPKRHPKRPSIAYLKKNLMTYDELEEWRKDNEWILSGYRISDGSFLTDIKSLFFLHNETGNIYSHLLAAVFFIGVAILTFTGYAPVYADLTLGDKVMFGVFFVCAVSMLLLSSSFHLFCDHSVEVSETMNRCDYLGIMTMIVGSVIPALYYALGCAPGLLKWVYLALAAAPAIPLLPMVLRKSFLHPTFRAKRAILFVTMSVSGALPFFHVLIAMGYTRAYGAASISNMAGMAFFYLLGASLYATRTPEKYAPGRFDFFLSSHQLFHFCVVLAALSHWRGLVNAHYWHSQHGCLAAARTLTGGRIDWTLRFVPDWLIQPVAGLLASVLPH
ncbi:hypothetical protein H696_03651 [Fonticula alba]|uniref:Hemolysin III n=1 Tax=Fonticula alba TaxID=691883 RepID=A0A058Z8E3_FONAL|nr:hypothetical protein H696_03651 [Fonticula alba]KCV70193.1 hypothetical protein H696_03651 [Fonticula alba]|eukprot:XP_009495799.1 hypothetical protein H696_03651 [Fonticula alba]